MTLSQSSFPLNFNRIFLRLKILWILLESNEVGRDETLYKIFRPKYKV